MTRPRIRHSGSCKFGSALHLVVIGVTENRRLELQHTPPLAMVFFNADHSGNANHSERTEFTSKGIVVTTMIPSMSSVSESSTPAERMVRDERGGVEGVDHH